MILHKSGLIYSPQPLRNAQTSSSTNSRRTHSLTFPSDLRIAFCICKWSTTFTAWPPSVRPPSPAAIATTRRRCSSASALRSSRTDVDTSIWSITLKWRDLSLPRSLKAWARACNRSRNANVEQLAETSGVSYRPFFAPLHPRAVGHLEQSHQLPRRGLKRSRWAADASRGAK